MSTDATDPSNWSIYGTPGDGDDVYFGAVTSGSPNCVDLYSSGVFNSVTFAADYNGTVSLAQDNAFETNLFTLAGGAIAQPSPYPTTIAIRGVFTWTGGVLNSALTGGTVLINGGGSITLPGEGNTLTTGSALNFGNSDTSGSTVKQTIISGAGALLLNGPDAFALNTQPNAGVLRKFGANVNAPPGANRPVTTIAANGAKTLTIAAGSYWGYTGWGGVPAQNAGFQNAEGVEEFQVDNKGGYFFVGTTGGGDVQAAVKPNLGQAAGAGLSTVTVTLQSGNTRSGYVGGTGSILEINAGCVLDVSQAKAGEGAVISGAFVQATANSSLQTDQVSTLKGDFKFQSGAVGFAKPLVNRNGNNLFVKFIVTGNVTWTGGDFVPSVDCSPGALASARNVWQINGTLKVILGNNNPTPPTVKPLPQPNNVTPVKGKTWDPVIIAVDGKAANSDEPKVSADYEGLPDATGLQNKYTFSVKKK